MTFLVVDQDGDAIEATLATPAGPVTVICRVSLRDDRVVLYDLHVDGPGPRTFGPSRLRAAVRDTMEQFDVGILEVRGFKRTTGAGPGRLPPPLVFRRR